MKLVTVNQLSCIVHASFFLYIPHLQPFKKGKIVTTKTPFNGSSFSNWTKPKLQELHDLTHRTPTYLHQAVLVHKL